MGFVPVAPSPGPRAEFLEAVTYYEQRYTRLAETMPAEKYAWRPARGVRSVGEVFAHIAIANYGIANALVAARTLGVTFSFDNHLGEQVAIDALTPAGAFRRTGGVQQLCAQTNPIKVDAGGFRANSNYAQSYVYTHGAAVVGSRC